MQNIIQNNHLQWFRNATPYINTHRGKTFVIMFNGEAVQDSNFHHVIHDLALLHSLGIKLVLVHGARPQIDAILQNTQHHEHNQIPAKPTSGIRITTKADLPYILQAVGAIRIQIEAQFSMGLANSPMYGSRIDVVSGNFVIARPYGVRGGVDYQFTGEVRKIDSHAIQDSLDNDKIVLLGSVGYSATGEIFNLLAEEVAIQTAIALQADKLIFLGKNVGLLDKNNQLVKSITPTTIEKILQNTTDLPTEICHFLQSASKACQNGVHRTHLLPFNEDGALLQELFTHEGYGTLVSNNPYEEIRQATIDDIGGLIELLEPLEAQGILVKRPKERLESEIELFSIIERDGQVMGCGALYPLDETCGEIAGIAIHPSYRQGSRGADLVAFLEEQARQQGMNHVFALTTRTAHWFMELGFVEVSADELPQARYEKYQNGRNSKVLKKML